jgi:hypothetical protein
MRKNVIAIPDKKESIEKIIICLIKRRAAKASIFLVYSRTDYASKVQGALCYTRRLWADISANISN